MINFLSKIFIKNYGDYGDAKVRRAYGMLCSFVGIAINILLFAAKYAAGVLSASVAITADAFNNLSDAGSSVITLLGFRLAGKKPDRDHPFGHGRVEYLSGLAVAVIVIVMGIELAKTSFEKILDPTPVEFNILSVIILAVSVAAKGYMFLYNRAVAKKIGSAAMKATAADSISDAVSTAVVLAAILTAHFTNLLIDGWCGLLVAVFILCNGWNAAKDTLAPLLGQAPEPEFVADIERITMAHDEVAGIHDLVVHDYGPGRVFVSLHAEVPADGDICLLHDAIDLIERELADELGCEATIHMDPIAVNDERVAGMRRKMAELVKEIDGEITVHDFRIVEGPTHTNLIFDVVKPTELKMTDAELRSTIEQTVERNFPNCFAVIKIDKAYV